MANWNEKNRTYPLDTGRKLNVYMPFRRYSERLLNVLCTTSCLQGVAFLTVYYTRLNRGVSYTLFLATTNISPTRHYAGTDECT